MTRRLSLRARLTFVILLPLLVIAGFVGAWAYIDAKATAAERFDRSLLSTALAISRDTAVTGGDALSEQTRDLLRDTSGGAVFYHVYAPDGVFVTGYATPPVPPVLATPEVTQTYYDAVYQGATVRALRFTQSMSIDGLNGLFTFTVWQNTSVRDGFLRTRTRPTFLIMASMIGALAVIVWFGVRLGLYPLIDLEEAIAQRSADDLSPIRRAIPVEVTGVVGAFNGLVSELSHTLDAKNIFISDAAHQLRNPISGVLSLAESMQNARDFDDAKERSADILAAARETAALANNLLTLERARAKPRPEDVVRFEVGEILVDTCRQFQRQANASGIQFETSIDVDGVTLSGDPVMFGQAVINLLNNAVAHGGDTLSQIWMSAHVLGDTLIVEVSDDGKGILPKDFERALGRFGQIAPSAGSGLGLPIAKAIVERMHGQISLKAQGSHFSVRLAFPQAD